MGTTQELVRFVLDTRYDDFPQNLVEIAKVAVFDALGNMIGGARERVTQIAIKYAKDSGGTPECGIIGGGFRTSLTNAAFINGASAHSLELENGTGDFYGVAFSTVPVALNVAEKFKLSGKAVLEGLILGWEFQSRVARGTRETAKHGLMFTVQGTLGRAVTACKIMNLTADQTEMAVGLAAAQAGGLSENGYMCHLLDSGFEARDGVIAALLAKEGMTAQPGIIEGRRGFAQCFCPVEGPDFEIMTKNLGKQYYLISPGYYIKKYGCCVYEQGALDAIFGLIQEHNIHYNEVDSVQVEAHPAAARPVYFHDPRDGEQSKFSFEQALGAAIVDEKPEYPYLRPFTDAGVADPKYKEARRKVSVVIRDDWINQDVHCRLPIVTLKLKDGCTYSGSVGALKGSPENPLSKEELVSRFEGTVRGFLSTEQIKRTVNLVFNMETLPDVLELMKLVTFGHLG